MKLFCSRRALANLDEITTYYAASASLSRKSVPLALILIETKLHLLVVPFSGAKFIQTAGQIDLQSDLAFSCSDFEWSEAREMWTVLDLLAPDRPGGFAFGLCGCVESTP
jgi:hypothetical protein